MTFMRGPCPKRNDFVVQLKDHAMAEEEEVLSDSLGCLGTLIKDTAGATHALTCGVPDRESNETKYLKEALEMISDWQSRCSRRSSDSQEGPDITEVVLDERPQLCAADVFSVIKQPRIRAREACAALSVTREP